MSIRQLQYSETERARIDQRLKAVQASIGLLGGTSGVYATVTALLAATATFTPGSVISAEGFRYEVAAVSASDHHLTTAGGTKLYVLPEHGAYLTKAFGRVGAETDNGIIQRVLNAAATDDVRTVRVEGRVHSMSGGVVINHACDLQGEGRNSTQLVAASTFTYMVQINNVFGSVSEIRMKGENTVSTAVEIAALGSVNADVRVSGFLFEKFARSFHNKGSDGVHVSHGQSRLDTSEFFLSDNNLLNSSIEDVYAITATGGRGIVIEKSSLQAEGLTVANCKILTPGAAPLVITAGLACHFSNTIFDQGGDPALLDMSDASDAGYAITFHGCWFNGKSGSAGAFRILGNPSAVKFFGCTFVHVENYGIEIGASAQNVELVGCDFLTTGTSASCIGVKNLGAKGGRFIANTFGGYSSSARAVQETSGTTSVFYANRFAGTVSVSDFASGTLLGPNYGLGASATTGAYQQFFDDGSASLPAVSFRNDQDAGFYKTGNGFAASVGGAAVQEFRAAGTYQVAGKGSFGAEVVIPDDAVFSFTPPASSGFLMVRIDEGAFEVEFRAVGGLSRCVFISASVIVNFEVTTGALAGTTGNDNRLTVSAHTDGKLYIENRRGSAKTVSYSVRA